MRGGDPNRERRLLAIRTALVMALITAVVLLVIGTDRLRQAGGLAVLIVLLLAGRFAAL